MASKFWLHIDRWLAGKGWHRFIIPTVLAFIVLISVTLIWTISNKCFCLESVKVPGSYRITNTLDGAFYSLFTNGGQYALPDGISHIWGIIVTVLGILILAVITSTFTNFFERRAEGYLTGETAYHFTDHIVIIGVNDIIYSIINQCTPGKYILVQTSRDVKQIRNEVFSFLSKEIDKKYIVFVYGDRTSDGDISKLSITSASEIYVIGDTNEGKEHESYRDAYNMDSVNAIANVLDASTNENRIPCHVLFEYQTTFSAYQFAELSESIRKHIDFRPFNFHEMWAQKVLIGGKAGYNPKDHTYNYLYKFLDEKKDGTFITESSDETVHLIIVGMSKMGIGLAIEAAQLLHFPNYVRDKSKKTRITFIDENADKERDFFTGRFKELFRLSNYRYTEADPQSDTLLFSSDSYSEKSKNERLDLDLEWEFIKGRIEQKSIQEYIAASANCKDRIVTIAICIPQSHKAIAAAIYLPDNVYENCSQILVYQKLSGYIVNNISGANSCSENYRFRKLRPFGMIDEGYDSNIDDDSRARMVSYVYDSFYDFNKPDTDLTHYDEVKYQNIWITEKTVSDRWSSKFNANTLSLKLRSIGCSNDMKKQVISTSISSHLDTMAEVEHNRWNVEKLLTGYRALTDKEWDSLLLYRKNGKEDNFKKFNDYRNSLKNWPTRAHADLCSFEELKRVDPDICHFDYDLCKAIPGIIFYRKK